MITLEICLYTFLLNIGIGIPKFVMVFTTFKLSAMFSPSQTKLPVKIKLILIVLVLSVAIVGDCLVDVFTSHSLLKCISDNGTHFMIAVISWIFIEETNLSSIPLGSLLLCGMMASIIDLDHFIAARSFSIHVSCFLVAFFCISSFQLFFKHLQEATSLPFRPILHWTTLPMTFFIFLVILAFALHSINLYKLAWMILTALGTHHLRDGYRRGIWMYPLPSIPPFPYSIYLIGLVAIMMCFNYVMNHLFIMHQLIEIQPEAGLPIFQIKAPKIQTV